MFIISNKSEHEKEQHKNESKHEKHNHDKTFYQKPLFILLSFLIFSGLFVTVFYMNKDNASDSYDKANNASLGIKNYGMSSADRIEEIFLKYGSLMGIGLGLIGLIIMYILYGISAIAKLTKYKLTSLIIIVFTYILLAIFGIELTFFENRYTTLGNAVIFFIGYPLMIASIITIIITKIFLALSIIKKSK